MAVEVYQIYQSIMLDIKIRIREIDIKLGSERKNLSALDAEFCFLQTRKIVEQITFSSVLCDKQRYKDFRLLEEKTSDDKSGTYEKDWNSRVILSKLIQITPHFMPIPLGDITISEGLYHYERSNVIATHNKLINIYKKCGSFLHIPNPFSGDYESHINKQRNRYNQATETIRDYSKYFKNLLWHHAAIGLEYNGSPENFEALDNANPKTAFLINFQEYETNNISIVVARAD